MSATFDDIGYWSWSGESSIVDGFRCDRAGDDAAARRRTMRTLRTLRVRLAAVRLARTDCAEVTVGAIAKSVGASERTVRNLLQNPHACWAFPPPELAVAIVERSNGAESWPEVLDRIEPLFVALDGNVQGRELLAGLARVRREHPEMAGADNYFAVATQDAMGIDGASDPRQMAWVGYLTESLRSALLRWSAETEGSLLEAHRMTGELLLPTAAPDER
jgi:hypothetical protein